MLSHKNCLVYSIYKLGQPSFIENLQLEFPDTNDKLFVDVTT